VFLPLYKQIKSLLVQRLQQERVEARRADPERTGTRGALQVSQGTVPQAVDELAAENAAGAPAGQGTFVAPIRSARAVPLPATGARPSARRCRRRAPFSRCRRARPPAGTLAQQLAPARRRRRRYLRRLPRRVGRQPLVLDDIWLPAALFRGLDSATTRQSIEAAVAGCFRVGVRHAMIRADERIRAVAAPRTSPRCWRLRRRAAAAGRPRLPTPTATAGRGGAAASASPPTTTITTNCSDATPSPAPICSPRRIRRE